MVFFARRQVGYRAPFVELNSSIIINRGVSHENSGLNLYQRGGIVLTHTRRMACVLCLLMRVMIPVSAAFHFFPIHFNRAVSPAEDCQTVFSRITWDEALEIAKAQGVKDDPCCPGQTASLIGIRIDGKVMKAWYVRGQCGKAVYLDAYSGNVVRTDYYGCMCYCSDTKRT